jgi:Na+-transporting NADH:ubiquinone oxidoreductase subunit C
MHSNFSTYRFIVILTGIAALLLSFTSTSLNDRIEQNKALDVKKNILKVAGIEYSELTIDQIEKQYSQNILEKVISDNNYYLCKIDDSFIIPIEGKGLWGEVKGFIALQKDLNTIKDITFYSHQETPGLGGEIEKVNFTSKFIGELIFNNQGEVAITIAKGDVKDEVIDNIVDGISGATLTTKGVNVFLKDDLTRYLKLLKGKG